MLLRIQLSQQAILSAYQRTKRELEVEHIRHRRIFAAVFPDRDRWIKVIIRTLTFRITQVLTRNGCFGEYLHWIGTENTPIANSAGLTSTLSRTCWKSACGSRSSAGLLTHLNHDGTCVTTWDISSVRLIVCPFHTSAYMGLYQQVYYFRLYFGIACND